MNPHLRRFLRQFALLFMIATILVIAGDVIDQVLLDHTSYRVNR